MSIKENFIFFYFEGEDILRGGGKKKIQKSVKKLFFILLNSLRWK